VVVDILDICHVFSDMIGARHFIPFLSAAAVVGDLYLLYQRFKRCKELNWTWRSISCLVLQTAGLLADVCCAFSPLFGPYGVAASIAFGVISLLISGVLFGIDNAEAIGLLLLQREIYRVARNSRSEMDEEFFCAIIRCLARIQQVEIDTELVQEAYEQLGKCLEDPEASNQSRHPGLHELAEVLGFGTTWSLRNNQLHQYFSIGEV